MKTSLPGKLRQFDITRLIAPDDCLLCDQNPGALCQSCLMGLEKVMDRGCGRCGNPEVGPGALSCEWCDALISRPNAFCHFFAYRNEGKDLVKFIKYHGFWNLIPEIVDGHLPMILKSLDFEGYDCFLPVPETLRSKLRRSYNPSREVAVALAKHVEIPIINGLKARAFAARQTGKSREDRCKDIRGKYQLKAEIPKSVILVDDVVTTGATLGEITRLLRRAKVKKIAWLTLFRSI